MIKKTLILTFGIIALSACVKSNVEKKDDEVVISDSFKLTEDFVVPIKQGLVTVITRGKDTLCVTDLPNQTIQIPKVDDTKSSSENSEIVISYVTSSDLKNFKKNSLKCEQDYLLFFEDTKEGDYDYNDLVIYARLYHYHNSSEGQKTYLLIKPVAFGAAKTIAFGIEGNNNSSVLISSDVRKELFLNKDAFTNTKGSFVEVIPTDYYSSFDGETITLNNGKVNARIHKNGYFNYGGWFEVLISNYGYEYCVNGYANFYILVDGNKFYVASASTKPGAYPYGIAIPNGRYWLRETISVDKGFLKFSNWASTGYPLAWYYKNSYLNKESFFEPDRHEEYFEWNYYNTKK